MKNQLFSFLVICVIIGILISEYLIDATNLRIYFLLLLFCLFISQLIKNVNIVNIAFGLQFICLGIILHQNQKPTEYKELKEIHPSKIHTLLVLENEKSSKKYLRYKVQNLTFDKISLLHIPLQKNFIYPKDTLIVYGSSYPLGNAKNPYQFNYSLYLQRKKITHQLYADSVLYHTSKHQHWAKIVIKSKENIRNQLENSGYHLEARSIISSMLLGDRTELSDELNESYIATGVIHILSISGLHVVMIFMIIRFLLQPLQWIKHGKQIQIVVALLIIWGFALYVEMRPPVFRASLMLTIYYTSELLKRPKNIYHTLALSALIILLYQPNYLFDVGFQLSFSAVFFIVWLHPIYTIIYRPKKRWSIYLFDLSRTSISAQFGTLPFSALYFNQFSWLFLFGNIILVPASLFMIIGAMIALFMQSAKVSFSPFVRTYNLFIEGCNSYIKWLATHDSWVLKQVYISPFTALLIVIILIALRPLIEGRRKTFIIVILGCFLGIQLNRYLDITRIRNSNEIIIFHQYKGSIVGVREGQNLTVFHDENYENSTADAYIIRPYTNRQRIKNINYYTFDTILKSYGFYKSKNAIFTSKFNVFIGENLSEFPKNMDYLLIRNSSFQPKKEVHLSQIKRVIADGSNYPRYVSELDSIIRNQSDSLLWNTSEQGFYRIKF